MPEGEINMCDGVVVICEDCNRAENICKCESEEE